MIRAIVNRLLKVVMAELFIDVPEDAISVSMGVTDIFSESSLSFKNLSWRPDVFDAHLQPFKLVSGHIEKLTIEGFAEIALGGSIKCHIENLFFLFEVDTEPDAQRAQFLKKLLVEMASEGIQFLLLRELIKQVHGFSNGKDPDIRKKRALMIKSLTYFFNSVQLLISSVHVRLEYKNNKDECNALGVTIPTVRLSPQCSRRPDGLNKSDPLQALNIKGMHIYADYDCESYRGEGLTPTEIFKVFRDKWSSEVHTAMVAPIDIEIAFGAEMQKKSGLVLPKVLILLPILRFILDPRQVELLAELTELIARANIRIRQLLRVRVAYTRDELPRIYSTGGSHILPQLSSGSRVYPAGMTIPTQPFGTGLVALMKAKMGNKWRKALWKHLIRLVIEDVRATLPLGNWVKVAHMAYARKDYALSYSKLLKVRMASTLTILFFTDCVRKARTRGITFMT
jgi:hypothetical protein